MENLLNVFDKARKGDKDSMLLIIDKFNPLINKYAYKLNYEDGRSELTLFLIELVNKINVDNGEFLNDACIVSYINKSFVNEYFKLSNKQYMKSIIETCLEKDISDVNVLNKVVKHVNQNVKKVVNQNAK